MVRGKHATLIIAMALLLAGCGGDSDDGENAQAPSPGETAAQPDNPGKNGGSALGDSGTRGEQGSEGSGGNDVAPGTGGVRSKGEVRAKRKAAKRRSEREGASPGSGGEKGKGEGGRETPTQQNEAQSEAIQPDSSKSGAERYKGSARSAYENAKLVCGAGSSVSAVAKELGLRARDAGGVAAEYAQEFPPQFRRAAAEGCAAGLK